MFSMLSSFTLTTFFLNKSKKMRKKNMMIVFFVECQIIKKKICKKLQILINNEHIYVNNELFFKICKNKSKNAEFSLRFSKNVN